MPHTPSPHSQSAALGEPVGGNCGSGTCRGRRQVPAWRCHEGSRWRQKGANTAPATRWPVHMMRLGLSLGSGSAPLVCAPHRMCPSERVEQDL